MHVPREPVASCCTHARMHDAARAARVAAGARRAGPSNACTHVYRCASYCRMRAWVPGLPACMACVRVSGTLCLSCVRTQRAGTNTQTHTYAHMRSISREGGSDHSSLLPLFVSPSLTNVLHTDSHAPHSAWLCAGRLCVMQRLQHHSRKILPSWIDVK